MSVGEIIYRILIGPLELFFEVVFVVANRMVENPGYAIIILSLAMNILVLPLYHRADVLQREERDKEQRLAPWIKHIKKHFKGNERFMMLQAYYRQNDYRPTDALKGSVSLVLEIPFFIAAYHFLSHLTTLKGVAFGPIPDLGAPDGLMQIAGTTFNLLPILMTLVNLLSAAIYLHGFPFKSKIQMYGVAAIFLVFLYRSPAGLVFYWTLNNVFSLVKNILYKIPLPKRDKEGEEPWQPKFSAKPVFFGSCAVLTVLTGLLIPSAVLNGSVAEFINPLQYISPWWLLVSTATIAFGTFMIWFGIFFGIAGPRGKQGLSLITCLLAIFGVVNYMFFGRTFGNFSADLQYDMAPEITQEMIRMNLIVLAGVALVVMLLWFKVRPLMNVVVIVSCLVLLGMAGQNMAGIRNEVADLQPVVAKAAEDAPEINLSKEGKNVVVIMMDRQVGQFIPYLMHEKPELKAQFDGFTYYANAVSFGNKTNFGAPALYGGYDYTTEALNARTEDTLAVKHDEALKVMPTLFGDAGYQVTLCEPTYAGYSWVPDLSVFDDHPEYKCFLANGVFPLEEFGYGKDPFAAHRKRMRNFYCFSLFRIAPAVLQPTLYESGRYNDADNQKQDAVAADEVTFPQVIEDTSRATGYRESFMQTYGVLYHLPNITKVNDEASNTFFMMSNDTAHDPMLLQEPAYEPAPKVDNREYDRTHPDRVDEQGNRLIMEHPFVFYHYQSNMAAMLQLGKWFDYLRAEGVWDNTRIIIVSDHGQDMPRPTDDKYMLNYVSEQDGVLREKDMMAFNCALLYKDFDATGFVTDTRLVTNADTPALATRGLIPHAANPFTNTPLTTYQEKPVELNLLYSMEWDVTKNNKETFNKAEWYHVEDNIFDLKNWSYRGYH